MPTTGLLNGTSMLLYVGGTAIAGTNSHTMNLDMATRPASTKESGGHEEVLEGQRSWNFDFDGLTSYDAAYGFEELKALWDGRTLIVVKFGTEVVGDPRYTGNGFLTNVSVGATMEDTVTYNGSIKGTGDLATETVT